MFVVVVVSKKPYNVVRTGLFGFGFEERGSLVENLVFVVVLSLAGSLVRSSNQLRARAFGAAEEARADGRNDASGPPGKSHFLFFFFSLSGPPTRPVGVAWSLVPPSCPKLKRAGVMSAKMISFRKIKLRF